MILFWILAALTGIYSLYITLRTNFTSGTLLLWLFTAFFTILALFSKPIGRFLFHTLPGRILLGGGVAAALVFAGVVAFVAFSGYSSTAMGNEVAIIVLGAGLDGEEPGSVLCRRLDAAYDTWLQNPEALLVVSGGQGPQEMIPEAEAMRRYLNEKGVPGDKILVENLSTSTEENLVFSRKILEDTGILPEQPVAVVTNAFHCYRAGRYAEMAGFSNAATIPASMTFWAAPPSYLREALAVLYLWLFKG